jgi:hypothetical protein
MGLGTIGKFDSVGVSIAGVGVGGPPPRPVPEPAGTLYCTPPLVAAHDEHPAAGVATDASNEAWPTKPLSTTGEAAEHAEHAPHGAAALQVEHAGSTTTGESTAVGAKLAVHAEHAGAGAKFVVQAEQLGATGMNDVCATGINEVWATGMNEGCITGINDVCATGDWSGAKLVKYGDGAGTTAVAIVGVTPQRRSLIRSKKPIRGATTTVAGAATTGAAGTTGINATVGVAHVAHDWACTPSAALASTIARQLAATVAATRTDMWVMFALSRKDSRGVIPLHSDLLSGATRWQESAVANRAFGRGFVLGRMYVLGKVVRSGAVEPVQSRRRQQ